MIVGPRHRLVLELFDRDGVDVSRPQTPVLYTTARGITDGTLEMFVKPYGFVAKPYTPADVLTAVKNLLDTK